MTSIGLPRGFKTWAENTSKNFRTKLGLKADDPLDYLTLGKDLNVEFWELDKINNLPQSSKDYLSSVSGSDWSAVTVIAKKNIIVLNPSHSIARTSSSAMHELSHIICRHEPAKMIISPSGINMRSYNEGQEAEADWLSGCLLLPRIALVKCLDNKISDTDACKLYLVSKDLYKYRKNITGVSRQALNRKSNNKNLTV